MEILDKIKQSLPDLSLKQKKIVELLVNDSYRSSFLTARELAKASGASSATVVRLARSLGFGSYKEMRHAFHESALSVPAPMQKLRDGNISASFRDPLFLQQLVAHEKEHLSVLLAPFLHGSFASAVEILGSARNVLILGARSSFSLAFYLGFLLQQVLEDVVFDSPGADNIYEKAGGLGEADAAVIFAFPRYSRTSVRVAGFLHGRGVRVIAVTDGPSSPLARYATCLLFCPNTSPFYSYTAAMSLCNGLILGLRELLGMDFNTRPGNIGDILLEEGVYF